MRPSAARGTIPFLVLRPRRRRQHRGLERAGGRPAAASSTPLSPAGYDEARSARGPCRRRWRASSNIELGLAFHADSAFLRGILSKTSAATRANTNGAVFCARSENDTGNNPHNPMYGINKAGADGALVTLIGTETSDSGGNSIAPDVR